MSSTGQYQVCCANITSYTVVVSSAIFVSNNYGMAWRVVALNNNDLLSCVSISSSGQYVCIGRESLASNSNLYISNNYGASFTATGPTNINYPWSSVSMSANGSYIVAVSSVLSTTNGMLSSVNYGATWNIGTASSASWNFVAMSANAQYITAVIDGGFIYNSVTPYINLSISNILIVYKDCSFNSRVYIGGPVIQF
jgi:hypothetical protein